MSRCLMVLALLFSCASYALQMPNAERVESIKKQQWIGLSIVSPTTLWVSGANGTIARTIDGGETWNYSQPASDQLQFRDIEGIDDRQAYALSIGNEGQSRVYYTRDGGDSWRMLYRAENHTFLNCLAMSPSGEAWIYGDSIDDHWSMVRSTDGKNWLAVKSAVAEPPQANEGGFASSGSCLRYANDTWIIGTGNADVARVLVKSAFGIRYQTIETPMQAGPAAGITSVWPYSEQHFLIAGGHLSVAKSQGARLWEYQSGDFTALPEPPMAGGLYSLAVAEHDATEWLLTSNPQGAAAYNRKTQQWHTLADDNIWTIQCHAKRNCWMVGKDGYLAKLTWR